MKKQTFEALLARAKKIGKVPYAGNGKTFTGKIPNGIGFPSPKG